MDELAWNNAQRVDALLQFVEQRISDRQLRLFACACYRRIGFLHVYTQDVVEAAERFADGLATEEELQIAADSAWVWPQDPAPEAAWVASSIAAEAAERSAEWASQYIGCQDLANFAARRADEERIQCEILRDIIGNPFQPVRIDPAWLTAEVVELARRMYERRDFEQMGELADRLRANGCDNRVMLEHCRPAGRHVRGCWLLDVLLQWRGHAELNAVPDGGG